MGSTLTTAQAQAHLDQWLAADTAVALGQSYTVEGQTVTRVDAATIRSQITYWTRVLQEIEQANAGNPGASYATPRFS